MAADNRLALLKQANKFVRQGKNENAIKAFRKILEIKPNDLEIRRIVGDLELKEHNTSGAVEQFEWIADYYLKEGFFTKAIAMFKRITRIDPNYEGVSFKLADLYTKQGLVIEAKQIYLDLAEEYKRKQNHKKALDMYKKILEFDRNNIKMRLLLADNYLREGLEDNAVTEYLTASDILINKKDFKRAEELLTRIFEKSKNFKIIEKLANCYTVQRDDQKAIDLLKSLGQGLYQHINLLKILGELYFRNDLLEEAEQIYKKITEIDSEEKEVILKLGKVYLQRKEYDKTYELFLPVIDKSISDNKFEEATSLLRFIIASNATHLPALTKLAEIFKSSGKRNNLIALYESLIPIYEEKNMRKELEGILEELIELSDSAFTYQEQLSKLRGREMAEEAEKEAEQEDDRRAEFIRFNLRVVEDALKASDYEKAIDVLKKTRKSFPANIEIRLKALEIYQKLNKVDLMVDEGVGLLDLYKEMNNQDEYNKLLDKLITIKPTDPRLVEMTLNEKTNIEIDFDHEELEEQMSEISPSNLKEFEFAPEEGPEDDVFLLSDEQSISPAIKEGEDEYSKSFTSYLSELDFYINDGYFGDADNLIDELKQKYPGNDLLLARIERFEKERIRRSSKEEDLVLMDEENKAIEVEDSTDAGHTKSSEFESKSFFEISDESERDYEMDPASLTDRIERNPSQTIFKDIDSEMVSEPDSIQLEEEDGIQMVSAGDEEDHFEIKSSISEESQMVQEYEDSRVGMEIDHLDQSDEIKVAKEDGGDLDNVAFEIEMEGPEKTDDLPIYEIDKEQLIQSPSAESKETSGDIQFASSSEFLDIDGIMAEDDSRGTTDSPFQEVEKQDLSAFENDEELLGEDSLLLEVEDYFEIEKNVKEELESIGFWVKELERQRTSTIEKNMKEIFQEFKKGVEEKIGQEDYDTRYNLGIAYKEMGLLEEAIHEFLISAKHPAKFFDSAGLLGMCFREKGMFDDAINWFDKALETPERKEEEYLAIRYELALTFRLKEDYNSAVKMIKEIKKVNPNFRDVDKLQKELTAKLQDSR